MSARLFFRVKTQFDNLGDALINRELIRLCVRQGTMIVCMDAVPDRFGRWLALEKIPGLVIEDRVGSFLVRFLWCSVGAMLRRMSVWYVLNPGGYLGEISTVAFIGRILKAMVLSFFRLMGVRTLLVGASYEDLGKKNLASLRFLSKSIAVHAVRDTGSFAYCKDNGVRVGLVLPDLAFNIELSNQTTASRRQVCLVSLRETVSDDFQSSLTNMLREAYLQKRFGNVELAYQVERDRVVLERFCITLIRGGLPVADEIVVLMEGIEENLRIYSDVEYVVSNRLHVLLLAYAAGAVPIAVVDAGSNEKIRALYRDLGIDCWCVEVSPGPSAIERLANALALAPSSRSAGRTFGELKRRIRDEFAILIGS